MVRVHSDMIMRWALAVCVALFKMNYTYKRRVHLIHKATAWKSATFQDHKRAHWPTRGLLFIYPSLTSIYAPRTISNVTKPAHQPRGDDAMGKCVIVVVALRLRVIVCANIIFLWWLVDYTAYTHIFMDWVAHRIARIRSHLRTR